MGKIISGFTMSLDGFIAEPNDDVGRLFKWYYSGDTPFPLPGTDMVFKMSRASAELFQDLFKTTGALVTGRRDFDVSRAWGGKPPFDVPTFVVTHTVPQEWVYACSPFTFVTDGVESAIGQARQAAGDKNVVVGGSKITQQCIKAGLLDEIYIDLASMLLGDGISLFGQLGIEPVELECTEVIEGTDVTHLRFRIVK
ncbi:MAG TPA: dihydrofolate reductase family protein [Chloroflexia bacterium]|nr:dihydrofolate reductase family protein [Chloroflexia bacterium]